jgi:hexosaminidase
VFFRAHPGRSFIAICHYNRIFAATAAGNVACRAVFRFAGFGGADIVCGALIRPANMFPRLRWTAVVLSVLPVIGAAASDLGVIPAPRAVTQGEGAFHVTATTPVACADAADHGCSFAAGMFVSLVDGVKGPVLGRGTAGPAIRFLRTAAPSGEGYRIAIAPDGVRVEAASDAGLFYGAVTLFQLATQNADKEPVLPAVTIEDSPRFAWRGLMLDSARHFQPVGTVKALIDVMAWHKLNVLHWHLADDQGWRIEIKKYPLLTKVGAFRTNAREGRYGGFYTQDQIREIVAYAKARNVTIVPEIEMPGHALAAIVAYPKLGSVKRVPKTPSGDWGIFPYLYNVNEPTFGFLENVLTEVMALFPSEYIHVGGDEAPKDQWIASPSVQQRMHALGIRNEKDLQGYFSARIARFLQAHGRRMIGWDEILEGNPPASAAVMSWRTVAAAGEAAATGHDVVMSPAPTLYFDYCQALRAGEPTCRGMATSLKDVYSFNPEPQGALKDHLLGVQANLWTEHMPYAASVEYAAFPRADALAEIAWSGAQDWNGFLARLPAQFERYRALGYAWSDAAFAVDIKAGPVSGGARIALSNQTGFGTIHYRTDGKPPTAADPLYAGPFDVRMPVSLTAVAFQDGTPLARVSTAAVDSTSILRRDSWSMEQCTNDLPLAQRSGTVVSFVNVMHPCWIYRGLDLGAARGLQISLGPLPFNFQLMHDIKKIPLDPKAPRGGALEIRADTCSGPLLATVKLPKTRGFRTVSAALAPHAGVHDICLNFQRRKVGPVWAIDWVQPLRKE